METAFTFLIGILCYNLSAISKRKNYLAGPVGASGQQGPQGPSGSAGPIGNIGHIGLKGFTGPIGPTGSEGPTGPTGSGSNLGPAGPTGPEMGLGVYISSTQNIFVVSKNDGLDWSSVSVNTEYSLGLIKMNLFMDICSWNGIYAAVGSTAESACNGIYLSFDCINWFLQTSTTFGYFQNYNGQAISVDPNTGVFAAVGLGSGNSYISSGTIDSTTMQLNWTRITNAYELSTVRYVEAKAGSSLSSGFYAAGNSNVVFFTGSASMTLKKQFSNTDAGGIFDLAYSKELDIMIITSWVSATSTSTLYWSVNATSWTACTGDLFSNIGQSITWNGSLFVACGAVAPVTNGFGEGPTIIWSDDGKVWHATSNSASQIEKVFKQFAMSAKWTGTRWIAVGSSATYNLLNDPITSNAAWSLDGKTWTLASGTKYTVPNNYTIQANAILVVRDSSFRAPDALAYAKIKKTF